MERSISRCGSTRGWLTVLLVVILSATSRTAFAGVDATASESTAAAILIDASAAATPPTPANYTYVADEASSPSGHTLGLNSQYLTLDGKPWLPVMGEMHYSRVPEAEWETEILKMKSAGVQIISTYIIWIHHEEVEGEWDWSGQRDLRRFVQLCAKHGMYVVPRIGPWSHAEVRNGGFPDWLLTKTPNLRSNDPAYLHYTELFFNQIGQQLKGLMWNQGGPVMAVQLENEYNRRGPLRGAPHILKLKELARDAGLRVPFYTVTGWDGGAIPHGAVLPVYGGYPDAPWDASIQPLPPNEVYAFRFGGRVTGNMGAMGVPSGNAANFTTDTPFMTAEMGGGMQVTYHRRPVVSADDIAAMMPVMLGSGVNLYGTYMFHGGENPDGKLTTVQESLATKYPNDLPVKTYDFEAPIGEFGQERESLLKLKTWSYFLNDFGAILAPMQPHAPSVLPSSPADLSVPRVSARTSGNSGFLFISNHVRGAHMPARENFQVTIKLPNNKSLTVPERPVTIPADAYFAWPFNLDLSGVHLRYATAQPFAILGTPESPVYAFVAQRDIPSDFLFDQGVAAGFTPRKEHADANEALASDRSGARSRNNSALVNGTAIAAEGNACATRPEHRANTLLYRNFRPGPYCMLHFKAKGRTVSILVLSQQYAEQAWRIASGRLTALVDTPQQAYVDAETITLQNVRPFEHTESDVRTLVERGATEFDARIIPGDLATFAPVDPRMIFGRYSEIRNLRITPIAPPVTRLEPKLLHPAGDPAPLATDFRPSIKPRVVAAAPTEADWSRAGTWVLSIPKAPVPDSSAKRMSGTNAPTEQQFLRVRYSGDVARLSAGDHLLTDDFYTGRPWLIGLDRFKPHIEEAGGKLQLSIYPLRPNPPIFFEPGTTTPPGAHLESVELITQYSLRLKLIPASAAPK